MRSRIGGVLGIAALGASLAACGSDAAGALAGKSPSQILSAGLAAAEAQSSVHYVIKATSQNQTQTVSGDAARSSGQQSVVSGTDAVDVVLLPTGAAFVRGNTGGLVHTVGIAATVAPRFADKWISVAPTDTLYRVVTQLITLRGILTQLTPSGTLQASTPGMVAGHEVIGVRGGLPGTATRGVTGNAILYVSTSNPTLPIGFSGQAQNASNKVDDAGAFTHWGETLHLTAPSPTVPFSSIPTS